MNREEFLEAVSNEGYAIICELTGSLSYKKDQVKDRFKLFAGMILEQALHEADKRYEKKEVLFK